MSELFKLILMRKNFIIEIIMLSESNAIFESYNIRMNQDLKLIFTKEI